MPKISRERRDDRRQHILLAATRCFARDGFHRTTIADVRREAAVSTGAIYTYFANKEAIIRAILDQARRTRGAQLEAPEKRAADALPQALLLLDWVRAIFEKDGRHAARVDVNLWAEALRDPRVAKIARAALEEAARAVRPVVATRMPASARSSARDEEAMVAVLLAIFLGLEVQTAVGVQIDADGVVRALGILFGTQAKKQQRSSR